MISVIIPTYNRGKTLPRAIDSVLNQTHSDFELIIVDDGSKDDTENIVKNIKDHRITYLKHEVNSGGPARPKNTGIKKSKGNYIAFLDSDDEWMPEKLEKQLKKFNDGSDNLAIVGCDVLDINQENGRESVYTIPRSSKDKSLRMILKKCFIHSTSSVLIKARLLNKVGNFDEKMEVSEDWDLWIRILKSYSFDFVPEPLFMYYIHDDNISTGQSSKKAAVLEYMLHKHINLYKKHKKAYGEMLQYIGNLHLIESNKKKARFYTKKSVKVDFRFKNIINYFLSFLSPKIYRVLVSVKRFITLNVYR